MAPVSASQTMTALSWLPLTRRLPSREKANACTAALWPASVRNGGGGGFMGGSGHRGSLTLRLKPRAERSRSNEDVAQDLRVKLTGLPGVVLRPRASGGNNQMSRMFNMGGEGLGYSRAIEKINIETGEVFDDTMHFWAMVPNPLIGDGTLTFTKQPGYVIPEAGGLAVLLTGGAGVLSHIIRKRRR